MLYESTIHQVLAQQLYTTVRNLLSLSQNCQESCLARSSRNTQTRKLNQEPCVLNQHFQPHHYATELSLIQ